MAKAEKPKPAPKPKNKKEQYERFKEAARELGIDEKTAENFEDAFRRIVPPKTPSLP